MHVHAQILAGLRGCCTPAQIQLLWNAYGQAGNVAERSVPAWPGVEHEGTDQAEDGGEHNERERVCGLVQRHQRVREENLPVLGTHTARQRVGEGVEAEERVLVDGRVCWREGRR